MAVSSDRHTVDGAVEPVRGRDPGHTVIGYAEQYGLIVVWAALIVLFGALKPDTFLTWSNVSSLLGSQAVLVVVTLGLIIPLTANDFDVSIANVMTLSSMVIAVLNVTLWISDSMTISGVAPVLVKYVIVTRLLGIPLEFYYAIFICVVVWYLFEYTAVGRRILFVGRGREVARLSGIRADRVRRGCLVASSFLGALAGVMYAGTIGAADPQSGLSYLLPAFAAAFLGATTIVPGRFNPWGATLSVYFLVTGITGLTFLGIRTFVQELFYGGALVVAVTLSQLVGGREERL